MKIAITGGIGSGKSYVCKKLGEHGITVYDCDKEAKRLMLSSEEIRHGLTKLIGKQAYGEITACSLCIQRWQPISYIRKNNGSKVPSSLKADSTIASISIMWCV